MRCYTDYPLFENEHRTGAPVREVKLVSYDGDKYVRVCFEGQEFEFKAGYLYTCEGRCGDVPFIGMEALEAVENNETTCDEVCE